MGTAAARPARAEEPRIDLRAGQVDLEPAARELRLRRDVVVGYGRFRLTSDDLRLRVRPEGGVEVEGTGRVALCPCPTPPVAFAFARARIDADGDLFVTWPRLEALGVPVLVAPWLWIRPPDRVGLLPPILAWRADGGLLAGGGVHLPWRSRALGEGAVDLTAAGFSRGGVAVGARARTSVGSARVEWDRLGADRVLVDGAGVVASRAGGAAVTSVTWDVDAIRGGRARAGTIDLDPAARPRDAAAIEASARGPVAGAGAIGGIGLVASAARGVGAVAVGPTATAALGGPIGRAGAWSALATGAVLGADAVGDAPLPIARASLDAEVAPRAGPLAVRIATREVARFAGRGASLEPVASAPRALASSGDAIAAVRVAAALPLTRAFGAAGDVLPIVHRVEPVVEARGAVAGGQGAYFAPLGGTPPPASYVVAGGLATSLGRWGGDAATLDARGGALGDAAGARPMAHARLGASTRWLGARIEAAAAGGSPSGAALVGRARVGHADALRLVIDAATLSGGGGREARAVAAGEAAWAPGESAAYVAGAGAWGGAGLVAPLGAGVTARVAVVADLGALAWLATRGEVAWRHPCGCLGLAAIGAARDGRPGADAWIAIDLVPP